MTHYEKVTREEIARCNYIEGTTRAYLRVLHDLAGYFQQPLEDLTPAIPKRRKICGVGNPKTQRADLNQPLDHVLEIYRKADGDVSPSRRAGVGNRCGDHGNYGCSI